MHGIIVKFQPFSLKQQQQQQRRRWRTGKRQATVVHDENCADFSFPVLCVCLHGKKWLNYMLAAVFQFNRI
jgi:hypothetical protein